MTASQPDEALFVFILQVAEQNAVDSDGQELAIAAWAFAAAGRSDASTFSALATAVACCSGDCNTQGVANTAWAFAMSGSLDASLFGTLATLAMQRVGSMYP